MKTLVIQYPDSLPVTLSLSAGELESEAKLALACKLYEMGRLSSGQAAAIAGLPRVSFLLSCQRFGVPSVTWDQDELNAELA